MQGPGSVPARPPKARCFRKTRHFRENGRGQSPAPTEPQVKIKVADGKMRSWALPLPGGGLTREDFFGIKR